MTIEELLTPNYGNRPDFTAIVNHAKDLRDKLGFNDEQILASMRTCYGLD